MVVFVCSGVGVCVRGIGVCEREWWVELGVLEEVQCGVFDGLEGEGAVADFLASAVPLHELQCGDL